MKRGLYLFVVLCVGVLKAQNVAFVKKNFPTQKEAFSKAIKNLHHGDALFSDALYLYEQEDFSHFKNAIPYFEKAYSFNPNNADLNYKLGVSILFTIHNERSLPYLKKAYLLDKTVSDDLIFYLGMSHQFNENWEEAIVAFQEYLQVAPTQKGVDEVELRALTKAVNKKISELKCVFREYSVQRPRYTEIL